MPDQVVIDQWELHHHLACHLQGDQMKLWLNVYQEMRTVATWKDPTQSPFDRDVSTHRLGSFDASRVLHGCGITEKMDCLAIIANVCRYKVRLDTRFVRSQNLDFDISIFVQALLNGDVSILRAIYDVNASSAVDKGHISEVYSWCKISPATLNGFRCDSKLRYLLSQSQFGRIKPLSLRPGGLICAGYLFDFLRIQVDTWIPYDPKFFESNCTCMGHSTRHKKECEEVECKALEANFWLIIQKCYASGLEHLAKRLYASGKLDNWRLPIPENLNPQLQSELEAMDLERLR